MSSEFVVRGTARVSWEIKVRADSKDEAGKESLKYLCDGMVAFTNISEGKVVKVIKKQNKTDLPLRKTLTKKEARKRIKLVKDHNKAARK